MEKREFNDGWTVALDRSSMLSADKAGERAITLPHDAMIEERRTPDGSTAGAGGYFPGGNYVYTKRFRLQEQDEGKKICLEFEGIYHRARVYLNGAYVTACPNGYRGFYADITPFLEYRKENVLEVRVFNEDSPNSRWYTGSGIYRPVYILTGGDVHICPDGVKIRTPDVAEDISTVEIQTQLSFSGRKTEDIVVNTVIKAPGNAVAASEKTKVSLLRGESPLLRQRIYVRNAALWSVDDPNLYLCEVEIIRQGTVEDRISVPFGIRHVQADPMHGLRINGEKVLLRGACIHHDNGVIGAVSVADAEMRRVRILKEAGFNALRMAHNPASKALLEACDKVGMLMIEESFDMWNFSKTANDYAMQFADQWERDVRAIVEKDFNHPSVIMYSIGNEIQELGTGAGASWNRKLANCFHELDTDRLVTNAVNGLVTVMDQLPCIIEEMGMASMSGKETEGDINDVMTALMGHGNELSAHRLVGEKLDEVFAALDICGYNYMRGRYEKDAAGHPNRITYGSETYAPDIDLNWQQVETISNVIGDFTWTGWDYIGEAGIGVVGYNKPGGFASGYPVYLAYTGDIDITGHRCPMSYYREIVWGRRKKPYIAVQIPRYYGMEASHTPWTVKDSLNSWTWPGNEGKSCVIEVYSDAEWVELLLEGRSLGRKPAGKDNRFRAFFETEYQPGLLEAVAWRDGKPAERENLRTAGKDLCLTMQAAGEGLVYIEVNLTDREGILNTSADRKVSLSVAGTGELLGFGSANPASEESFKTNDCTTWNGKALAVVRRTGQGTIEIMAEAEGTEPAVIKIKPYGREE